MYGYSTLYAWNDGLVSRCVYCICARDCILNDNHAEHMSAVPASIATAMMIRAG
jgi:hypothetical protein